MQHIFVSPDSFLLRPQLSRLVKHVPTWRNRVASGEIPGKADAASFFFSNTFGFGTKAASADITIAEHLAQHGQTSTWPAWKPKRGASPAAGALSGPLAPLISSF